MHSCLGSYHTDSHSQRRTRSERGLKPSITEDAGFLNLEAKKGQSPGSSYAV